MLFWKKKPVRLLGNIFGGDQQQLAGRVERTGVRGGVVGEHQRHDGDGAERHQRGAHAVQAEGLLAVPQAAHQQAQAEDAVQDAMLAAYVHLDQFSCSLTYNKMLFNFVQQKDSDVY